MGRFGLLRPKLNHRETDLLLWHQLTPYIQIMSPRTALCDTCQHFRNGLQYNAREEEEARDLLKRYKEHLVKAKLKRNYYNKNTKLAEISRRAFYNKR